MSGMSADRPVAKPSRLSKDPVGCERWKKTTGYIRKNIWNWRCRKYAKGTTNVPGKEATMHDAQVEPTIAAPEPPRVGSHMTFFMYVSWDPWQCCLQKQNFWFLPTCLPPRVGSQLRDLSPFCPKNRTPDSCLHKASLATKQKTSPANVAKNVQVKSIMKRKKHLYDGLLFRSQDLVKVPL